MRLYFVVSVAAAGTLSACYSRANVQCQQNSNCDLSGGGVCVTAPTGNQWCSYPDLNCPSGYRYSNQDIGDGVSGACVADNHTGLDAGADASTSDAPPQPLAASCIGLATTCGVNGSDSCCNSPSVPGGTYYRGFDRAGDNNSGFQNSPATISTFRLDKYEVTVGRFRKFVLAGMGTQASPPPPGSGAHVNIVGSGWDSSWNSNLVGNTTALISAVKCTSFATWTNEVVTNENRPINCITWYEAMAFCTWDGGYLPTEAEWNYAAAGGDQQRAYPWSSPASDVQIDGAHASYNDFTINNPSNCVGDGLPGCAVTDMVSVGTKPAGDGRWGQSELAGNVGEWTLDTFASSYANPCTDCANLADPTYRIARSGHFQTGFTEVRTAARLLAGPGDRTAIHGVRCARAP
jgi:formylglycine-generating enzyme